MSLDVSLKVDGEEVFEANITHNLIQMAEAGGIYGVVWRPEENGVEKAADVAAVLAPGLADMLSRPAHYEQFNAPNSWGLYKHFIPWLEAYLQACNEHPYATVQVSR